MKRAIWKNTIIAESDKTVIIEGNHYFPVESIKKEYFKESPTHTTCPWKGIASYYTIEVNKDQNKDAAWFYPKTSELAKSIEGKVAFWKGVQVIVD
ncbi:DUF427 domain-containing protein [Fluviicola taffensis]|uniref:DUF427 domain-containing protein n=1 Tax=Fluviicola taffensis (strain DSM 16823 / NCIMB 13979 / RW262) TaxID=755732 RepID=F2IGE6_FLUTR|nr:DUF427 domain-containing protein [Fluviicola taffensis]AEA45812.1 protein of unknown function DUF427 [Fluviicola taffensis DSM 16823]